MFAMGRNLDLVTLRDAAFPSAVREWQPQKARELVHKHEFTLEDLLRFVRAVLLTHVSADETLLTQNETRLKLDELIRHLMRMMLSCDVDFIELLDCCDSATHTKLMWTWNSGLVTFCTRVHKIRFNYIGTSLDELDKIWRVIAPDEAYLDDNENEFRVTCRSYLRKLCDTARNQLQGLVEDASIRRVSAGEGM